MAGGQRTLSLDADTGSERADGSDAAGIRRANRDALELVVVKAVQEELAAHEDRLGAIEKACGSDAVWRRLSL